MDMHNSFLLMIFLQLSESLPDNDNGTKHHDIISVRLQNIDEGTSKTFKNPEIYKVLSHVGDTCSISCEQTKFDYTLSWKQKADSAFISFPSYKAKMITINITLDRFDHESLFVCTAFAEASLNTSIFNISIKFVDSQRDSYIMPYPENLKINPHCSGQDRRYVIIDEKIHNYNSLVNYPKDTTEVCIHMGGNTHNNSDIYFRRNVTYMNKPKSNINEKEYFNQDKGKNYNKEIWIAVGGAIVALALFLIILVIIKRKRKSSPEIVSDPVYATAQDIMNRIEYAELDMVVGTTFSPNREEVVPYAQVVGVIKKKKNTRRT